MSSNKLAIQVSLNTYESSFKIRVRFVHIETETVSIETQFGRIEYPWSSFNDQMWMKSIEASGTSYLSTNADNPGWRSLDWKLSGNLENGSASQFGIISKKLDWIDSRMKKHAEKNGNPASFAEFVFHLAIVTKVEYFILPKNENSNNQFDYRSIRADGYARGVLEELLVVPIVEPIAS